MAISSSIRKSGPYAGNGQTTSFPFGFKIFDTGDVHVVRTGSDGSESALVPGTDFTVTVNGDQDSAPGGSIVLSAPLASGSLLTLTSNLDELQPTVLTNSGGFYPDVLNDSLDRLTILTQQLREKVDRAVVAPITESGGSTIPTAAARAGKIAWFDTDGQLSGWTDAATLGSSFDAVLQGTQPLRDLIGDLGSETLAQAMADIGANADLYNFGRFGVDLAFTVTAGGPLYRMAGDQRAVVTDLAAYQFARTTTAYALNADGSVATFSASVPRLTAAGQVLGFGGRNKVRVYGDTPIGLVGLDQSGDNAAVVSLVDDSAALAAAKLQGLVPSGKVVMIDNTHGTGSATIAFSLASPLTAGDTVYRAYVRAQAGTMTARVGIENLPGNASAEGSTASTSYVVVGSNVTITNTTSRVYVKASAGSVIYACLPFIGSGVIPPTVPVTPVNPGTFTGVSGDSLAQTVLDPVATTHLTKTGDAAAVLSLLDDAAAPSIQSILPSKTTAKVYQLDNSAGTGNAVATADCGATAASIAYQVYTFMRVVGAGTAYVQFEGVDIASWSDGFWNLIGATATAGTTAGKIGVRAPAGVVVQFVDLLVVPGSSLPAVLAPWALSDTPANNDDNLSLALPSAYNDLVVTWGGGFQTRVPASAGYADMGATGRRPWMGYPIDTIRSIRKSESLNVYTPPEALPSWSYTRRYSGTAYDPSDFPTLAFSDDFTSYSLADSDTGLPGGSAKWFGTGHTTFGFATFVKPSDAPHDTYTVDAGKLRIRMQLQDGAWTSGCLSSINAAGDGFTFTKAYVEYRMLVPMAAGTWAGAWATNEMPGLAQPHAEIDFVELYGTNPGNFHATLHIWPMSWPNPKGPSGHVQIGRTPTVTVLDGNYHTYGCAIHDDWIIHYLDRVEVCRAPFFGEVRLAPMHLLLNLAGLPDEVDAAVSPIDMYVDYVKVWTE
ncbi:family 16 glycosylhydrolase [Asticcacaulis solisilvae]|uniref:family 16 glycosylhydrolase n=1 Tax=Asticcacaulis solisilvae TaxID=1217274 RepID=UPI003FD747BE